MFPKLVSQNANADLQRLDAVELFRLCAGKREDSQLWAEFLRRFTPKIMYFIRGTLRQLLSGPTGSGQNRLISGAIQEGDLFQSTIIRLVEKDCAAMKRFSGTTESEMYAYLAVISRSLIQDWLRQLRASKRPRIDDSIPVDHAQASIPAGKTPSQIDRTILARELVALGEKTIANRANKTSARDLLIFQLYFLDDLSADQIAHCEAISLSKAGVEKILNCVTERVRMLASIGTNEAVAK